MRKSFIAALFVLMSVLVPVVQTPLGSVQRNQNSNKNSPPTNQQGPKFDLQGVWVTNDGEEVELTAPPPDGKGGNVLAVFTGNNKLPNGECKFGDRRERFIDGELSGKKITGKMWRCTESEPLFKDCHVPSVYTTTFTANVLSNDEIYGYRRSEYWGPGGNGACKYSRDKSGDRDVAFSLTRKQPKAAPASSPAPGCPSGEQKKSSDDNKALELVKDGFKKALKMLDDQRKEMDRNPSAFKDLAQAKEELDEKIKGIKEWLDFWDSINAVACMPPQVSQLLQRYAQETLENQSTSDFCTNMCVQTIDWFSKINSIPDYRKYQLKVGCMAATCN